PLGADKLCEVRLRSGGAVSASYGGRYGYVTPRGITDTPENAVVLGGEEVERVLLLACEKSLYAYNDRICRGFITLTGGIRVGVAGETVWEGATVKTVKNIAALNIRIPHEVFGCGERAIAALRRGNGFHSTLIVSPPGAGKTTLLRDLARIASSEKRVRNVLIADERDEIAASVNGRPSLCVGRNTDVISGCTKEYAFISGIRALRPDIIVTDELCGAEDAVAVENAVYSGVCVFASVHAQNHGELLKKAAIANLLQNKCFTRFIDVSERNGPGTIEGIFDENFCAVCQ
ncbi:MAG: Flp pilus assembly complex ATPase component TadA, partial [Clostridiales bacterium]|nr:Flp pilus assembly complex ATPase component TadA [Clostridiales bacterium]